MSTKAVTASRQAFVAPADLQRAVEGVASEFAASPGEVFFRIGESRKGVFLVVSGEVRLSLDDEEISMTAGPGSLLGLPATVRDNTYTLTAEAVTDVRVAHVDHDRMRNLLNSDAKLCFDAVQVLGEELQAVRRAL
jgi:CRP-like cAMP-binding protein